jgi:hypothetical protein
MAPMFSSVAATTVEVTGIERSWTQRRTNDSAPP